MNFKRESPTFKGDSRTNSGDYSATINWGDGVVSQGSIQGSGSDYSIIGTHVYATVSGSATAMNTYPVKVTISRNSSIVAPVAVDVKAIVNPPPFQGGLSPQSDSGAVGDGITNSNQPVFSGSTFPFALVQVYVQRDGRLTPVPYGRTVARSDGGWTVHPLGPFSDGFYKVSAVVTPTSGSPVQTVELKPLTIDTVGPIAVGSTYDRSTRTVTITFRDALGGLDLSSLRNARNFRFNARSGPAIVSATVAPEDPKTAIAVLDARSSPSARSIRVIASGIVDEAGNSLGADYIARLGRTPIARGAHPGFVARRMRFPFR